MEGAAGVGLHRSGRGLREQVVVPVEHVCRPDALDADAVTLGGSGVVAHFGLPRPLRPGERCWCAARPAVSGSWRSSSQPGGAGAVAVTTSSAERGDACASSARPTCWTARRRGADAPAGFDVIIDVVAGEDLPLLGPLNPNGRLVAVGGRWPAAGGLRPEDDGRVPEVDVVRHFSAATVPEPDRRAVRCEQFAAASRGELQTVVHEVLPLEQAVLAHREMDAGEVFGGSC